MQLTDLTPDEDVVLVGLLREIVQADADYTDEERALINGVREAMGGERFDAAIAKAREQYNSRSDLKEDAKKVERPQARELMYDVLLQVAESDGLHQKEEKPLRWLASWWGIER